MSQFEAFPNDDTRSLEINELPTDAFGDVYQPATFGYIDYELTYVIGLQQPPITVYLETGEIDVELGSDLDTNVFNFHLPTTDIQVNAVDGDFTTYFLFYLDSTATIAVEAEAVDIAIASTLDTAEITIESEEVAPGLAFYAETAEIAVEAEPVDAELGPFILETAEIFVGAEAVRLPFILPTTDISVEAVPGHTGEVKVLTTADITIGAEPVSALAFIAIEMNFDLPPPIIYVYGQGQSPVDGPPDPGDDWIEIYAGAEIPAISKLVCHVRAVYQVIDRVS